MERYVFPTVPANRAMCCDVKAKMPYETGMTIMFDVVTKIVFIEFRGHFTSLIGPFKDRPTGVAAGEDFCRSKGWIDPSP